MTSDRDWIARLYLLNAALFVTHEIDSGFWREWELFRLPGSLPGFLVANFVLILAVQMGFRSVLLRRPTRRLWAAVLAAGGIIAAVLHGAFLIAGLPAFATVTSLGLLGVWLAASIAQLAVIWRERA